MTGKYELIISKAELEEINGFVNLLDCSDKLKLKVNHLYGYAKLIDKAEKTKAIYERLISDDE